MREAAVSDARFTVGIDLGTTNCAAAYADIQARPPLVRDLPIPQLVAPYQVESGEVLPSFGYEPPPGAFDCAALRLPWDDEAAAGEVVGRFAREHGALSAGRQIASAKSWLCHPGVDRTAPILPWHAAEGVTPRSPVEASAAYLRHIARAWTAAHPDAPIEEQDVVVAVPASFDEIARELTLEAARRAGLPRVALLEEPQAAFYAWMDRNTDRELAPGATILVCDIGGGTTDFTLIRADAAANGRVSFRRVSVGDHLMLGGDNLDLALARDIEERLGQGTLDPRRWGALLGLSRSAKERLLGASPPEAMTVSLPAGGARVLGGAAQIELRRADVEAALLDGFLPVCGVDATPARGGSGLREMGLPYAADPGITRHLAAFLREHREAAGQPDRPLARPDAVLFNGGFFESATLKARLLDVMRGWFEADWQPTLLENRHLYLAVARGAARFGLVRRGLGERVTAGLGRAYFIGVEHRDGADQALCIAPAGLREGETVTLDGQPLRLRIRRPVEFPVYASASRAGDRPGDRVSIEGDRFKLVAPIRTVIQSGKGRKEDEVPVVLTVTLSDIGSLDVGCRETPGDRSWRLQFDARAFSRLAEAPEAASSDAIVEDAAWAACERVARRAFGRPTGDALPPERIGRAWEEALGAARSAWSPSTLRRLWGLLMDVREARAIDPEREARWLQWTGYTLRPGYGVALDDWRMDRLWSLYPQRVRHGRNAMCLAEWWILWRRVAGGLNAGRQRELAEPLRAVLRAQRKGGASGKRMSPHEWTEALRALGALERLGADVRGELGDRALERIERKGMGADNGAALWALGRLGARAPVYGPLNTVVPVERVEAWCERLMALGPPPREALFIALLARRTDDRYRDLGDDTRKRVADWLEAAHAAPHAVALVREGGALDTDEQAAALGEAPPRGLLLDG